MPLVLCLDSRPVNLKAEGYLLERAGYRVLRAESMEEAAELLQRHSVDLVLVSDDLASDDHVMCSRLHELAPSARIILQRAAFGKPSAPQDADLVLPKTIDPREKLRIISRLLLRRAA